MAKKSTKRSKKPDEQVKPITPIEVDSIPDGPQAGDEASPETDGGRDKPADREFASGLTSLTDYYQDPEPEPERVLTAAQLAAIREDAFSERFGAPVPDFRSAVVARLNDKLRS